MKVLELKNALIDDLKVCISYEPHKEHDLLCMMEQYLKSENRRKSLLPDIKNLLDDKPYQNPFAINYPYCERDIVLVERILSDYITSMDCDGDHELILCNTISQINELHDRCGNELIDEWRNPKLEELLILTAKKNQLDTAASVVHQHKRW